MDQGKAVLRCLKRRHGEAFLLSLLDAVLHEEVASIERFVSVDVLPLDLLALVLGKYGYRDANSLSRTCRRFNVAVHTRTFWIHGARLELQRFVGVSTVPYCVGDFDPFVRHSMMPGKDWPFRSFLRWIFDDKYRWQQTNAAGLRVVLRGEGTLLPPRCMVFNWRGPDCGVVFGRYQLQTTRYEISQVYYAVRLRHASADKYVAKESVYEYDCPQTKFHYVVLEDVVTGRTFRGRGIGRGGSSIAPDEANGYWSSSK